MGSKDPKENKQQDSASASSNVDVPKEESSVGEGSSSVLAKENDSAETSVQVVETVSESTVKETSSENDDEKNVGRTDEIEEKVKVEEPVVETLYLDDSKVGKRFSDFPLSESVLKGLSSAGYEYVSRYQQVLLNSMTLGESRWFSINLASNRGIVIGAYLLDLAQYKPDSVSTIICVAVPKIRQYFENDFLGLGQFTGVKVLAVHEPLQDGFELDVVPNIIIASIQDLQILKEKIDFNNVETVYFDEVEKTIRDSQSDFVDFVQHHKGSQVLLQSSFYSKELVSVVQQVLPELHPTRIYKNYGSDPSCFVATEVGEYSLDSILTTTLMQRSIVIVDDENLSTVTRQLQGSGWDVDSTSDEGRVQSILDSLRENRLQSVVMTQDQFLQAQNVEFDILIFVASPTLEEVKYSKKKYKRLSSIVFMNPWVDDSNSLQTEPISNFLGHRDRHNAVIDRLREGLMVNHEVDWTGLIDDMLQQADGKQLLGEAVRIALQQKRSQQGYIRSHVYKLEKKDVFQRRNRRKSRR